jgi:hypothetical protein
MPFFQKKLVALIAFCTCVLLNSGILLGQNETSKWYFGFNAGLDFMTNPPTILTNGMAYTTEGSSSIADSGGNLLFYTKGDTIRNKLHQVMSNGDGLIGNQTTSQCSAIIKKPGSPNLYYVFTLAPNLLTPSFAYSLVDMNLASGNGSVTVKNTIIYPASSSEKLTVVKHCNRKDYWVIIHEYNSANFRAYLLSALGVNTVAIVSSVGTIHTGQNWGGCMKAAPNGSKLAIALYENPGQGNFELYDFNTSTGNVSNPIILTSFNRAYGCEFSADGSKLYATPFAGNILYQYNLCAGSPSAIVNSQVSFSATSAGQLQLASDGKIYVARWNKSALGVINNPNAAGGLCNYVDNGQSIAPKLSSVGLPNFNNDFLHFLPSYSYTFGIGNFCQTVSFLAPPVSTVASACAASSSPLSGLLWNFDDPASAASNTSSALNPTHVFSSPGLHNVKLILFTACGADTLSQNILVQASPNISVSGNFTVCPYQSTIFTASGATSYTWSNGVISPSISISSASYIQFIVTGMNSINGCKSSKTITLNVNPCLSLSSVADETNSFHLFPNPNTGIFTVETEDIIHIEVLDILNRILFEKDLSKGKTDLDLTPLPAGTYLIKCIGLHGSRSGRLIKIN